MTKVVLKLEINYILNREVFLEFFFPPLENGTCWNALRTSQKSDTGTAFPGPQWQHCLVSVHTVSDMPHTTTLWPGTAAQLEEMNTESLQTGTVPS